MEDLVEPFVEYAQRGFAHSHNILTEDAIRDLLASAQRPQYESAELLARQHAVSVMRPSGVLAILHECQA